MEQHFTCNGSASLMKMVLAGFINCIVHLPWSKNLSKTRSIFPQTLNLVPARLAAVQSIMKTFGSEEFSDETNGFFPKAIDVLTGLVLMLTSLLVNLTVA